MLPRIDSKDLQILKCLIRHPKATVEEVAREVGAPQATVQKRISSLIQEHRIERTIRIVDWSAVGYPLRYWIDINLNQRELRNSQADGDIESRGVNTAKKLALFIMGNLSKKYASTLLVLDVTMLLGSPADLSVYVRARDHGAVLDFITEGLHGIRGVEATNTFHEAWSSAEGMLF